MADHLSSTGSFFLIVPPKIILRNLLSNDAKSLRLLKAEEGWPMTLKIHSLVLALMGGEGSNRKEDLGRETISGQHRRKKW